MRPFVVCIILLLLLPVVSHAQIAQSTLPDFNIPENRDKFQKLVSKEFQLSEEKINSLQVIMEKVGNNQESAKTSLQKNPSGLAKRLIDIESHFNQQFSALVGEKSYQTYLKNRVDLYKKYTL